ncbi:MAG: hypothetical protein ACRCU2_15775 [Planktothrix sp.]
MDEQRWQAYLSLIQELLDCPDGEEADILNRHQEWVDEGLMYAMTAMAVRKRIDGETDVARFLQNWAQQIAVKIRMTLPELPVMVELNSSAEVAQSGRKAILWQFINTNTGNDSEAFLQEHPELLDEETDILLEQLVNLAAGEKRKQRVLLEHQELLQRCRGVGIEQVFAKKLLDRRTARLHSTLCRDSPSQPILANTVKNITLTLYAFHLKQGFDDSLGTVKTQGVQLWESLIKLSNVYPFPELIDLKSHLVSYTQNEQGNYSYQPEKEETSTGECLTHQQEGIFLSKIATSKGFNLTGEIEPYLLNDTYCLTLNLKPTDCEFELGLADLTAFHPHCLIKDITADLGKTLVFYGEQDEGSQPSCQEAEKWATALCANTGLTPEFRGELTFCHSPGFWFEASGLTLWILLAKPNQFAGDQFFGTAPMFRVLLSNSIKIHSTYSNVKETYKNAKYYYNQLELQAQAFYKISQNTPIERLQFFDKMIRLFSENLFYYNCYLRDLKTYQITIKTNTQNFHTALSYLLDAGGNELKAWSTLAEKTYPYYLDQVTLDLEYLESGKDVFSDLINTIRVTTEIERAKNEQAFRVTTEIERAKNEQALQNHIQAIGIGITAGVIVASTSGLMIQPKTERLTFRGIALHPLGWALLVSVLCALGSWLLAESVFKALRCNGDKNLFH